MYTRAIVPIGALFSVNLWLGNTAYMYLSVSFAQMLKVRDYSHWHASLQACSKSMLHDNFGVSASGFGGRLR